MRRREIADWSAGALAFVVLTLGGLVVVKPALDHWDSLYRADPFAADETSALERLLGNGGLLALRLIAVALAAFLVAAVLQRVILGEYGLRISRAQASGLAAASELTEDKAAPGTNDSGNEPAATRDGPAAPEIGASLAPPIAKLVASRREELGLSQRELAKRAGLSHTVISRIEHGEHTPSRKTLERLADALRAAR